MTEVELKRCLGHCCRDFTLPVSPKELEAYKSYDVDNELRKVAEMVIFLRTNKKDCATGEKVDYTVHHYTCKHHDTVSGDCMNYENRPRMCSNYPYGKRCRYTNCASNDIGKPQ